MSSHPESGGSSGEKTTYKAIFEHLFPGCMWKDVPRFRPTSLIGLFRLPDFIDIGVDYGRAESQNDGFACRVDVPRNYDRFLISSLLQFTLPIEETRHPNLGDLLKRDERLGRIATKRIQWVSTDSLKNAAAYGFLENDPPDWMKHTAWGKIIGVISCDRRPSALILYREGPRQRQIIEEQELVVVGRQTPQGMPVF